MNENIKNTVWGDAPDGMLVFLLSVLPTLVTTAWLDKVVTTDVIIIGAGVAGIRAAEVLHEDGNKTKTRLSFNLTCVV